MHRLDSLAYHRGNYVWYLPVVGAMVLVADRKRTMIEILMAGFLVIGFIASSTIALTLLLIVLGVIK